WWALGTELAGTMGSGKASCNQLRPGKSRNNDELGLGERRGRLSSARPALRGNDPRERSYCPPRLPFALEPGSYQLNPDAIGQAGCCAEIASQGKGPGTDMAT